jgi:L-alanine-DL-glutamate epimerase-like enolase superfamily enzyme
MRRGRVYEELGVYWFEEPMQPYMRDSHIRLAAALDIPIAIGENYFTRHQFYDVIKSGAVDIVQLDNRRAGGVTEWLDIAAVSELAGLKLASHGGGPATVCHAQCDLSRKRQPESGKQHAGHPAENGGWRSAASRRPGHGDGNQRRLYAGLPCDVAGATKGMDAKS